MQAFKISEKRIDIKTLVGTKTGIIQSIKYPFFESREQDMEKLADKMNGFYEKTARKYSSYGEKILSKKVGRMAKKCRLPLCMGMKYTAVENDGGIISVVLDLSCSEGKNIRMRRFTQMWSKEKAKLMTTGELLDLSAKNKKYIFDLVTEQAKNMSTKANKEFYPDVEKRVKYHFCFNNCFASPSGVVFFFDAGTLRQTKYGACCFVVPYKKLDGIVRIGGLWKKEKTENENL